MVDSVLWCVVHARARVIYTDKTAVKKKKINSQKNYRQKKYRQKKKLTASKKNYSQKKLTGRHSATGILVERSTIVATQSPPPEKIGVHILRYFVV